MYFECNNPVGSGNVQGAVVSTALATKYKYLALLSQPLSPCIKVEVTGANERGLRKACKVKDESAQWELTVIIMSFQDYQLVELENGERDFCYGCFDGLREVRNSKGFEEPVKYSVDEIQSRHLNKSPIAVFKLSNKNVNPVVYPVDSTGVYCVYTYLSSSEKDLDLALKIDFQQCYGKLNKWDHWDMYQNAAISLIYLLSFILYFYCISSSLQKVYDVTEMKLQQRNISLQHRILVYMLGQFSVYFWRTRHLYMLNKIGPENTSISEALAYYAYEVSNSGCLTWGLYNLLLFSSGNLFFSNLEDSKYLLFIRLLSLVTFISFLRAMLENRQLYECPYWYEDMSGRMFGVLRVECLVSVICVAYWSMKTYSRLCAEGSSGVPNRFLATIILALVPAYSRAFECEIIPDYFEIWANNCDAFNSFFDYSYVLEFITVVLIAYLWASA